MQAAPLALVHGNLVDVERRTVVSDATVVVEGEKIIAAGRARTVRVPADARVIDVRGKWITPGLVDAHIHMFQSGGLYTRPDAIDLRDKRPYETERAWLRDNAGDLPARYSAAGVTTVIDTGGPLANYALRDRYNKEEHSPTISLTGPLVSAWQPPAFQIDDEPILQAADAAAAREMVRKQLPYRPDFIKIWYIVDEEFIALLKKRAIPYIPTLTVSGRYFEVFTQQYAPTALRERCDSLFKKSPGLHCEIVNRIVHDDTVIDHERLHGRGDTPLEAVAIYTIKDSRISRVTFMR